MNPEFKIPILFTNEMERDVRKSASYFIYMISLYCHNNPELCYSTHFVETAGQRLERGKRRAHLHNLRWLSLSGANPTLV